MRKMEELLDAVLSVGLSGVLVILVGCNALDALFEVVLERGTGSGVLAL
jgi:hypothetical protein